MVQNLTSMRRLLGKFKGKGNGAVLARGASGVFAVKILGVGVSFGLQLLLARLLGVAQYGTYIYVLAIVNILMIVSLFGLNNSLVRFAAAYRGQNEWGLLRGVFRRSTQVVLLLSLVSGVIGVFVLWCLRNFLDHDQLITFFVAMVLLPFFSLSKLQEIGLRAFKQVIKSNLLLVVIRPAVLALLLVFLWFFLRQPQLSAQAMAVNVIAMVITFALGRRWLANAFPQAASGVCPAYEDKKWLKISGVLLLIDGTYMLLGRIDIIMIGSILGAKGVGVYSVSSRIAGFVTFGLLAANTIVAPLISELYHSKKNKELQRIITLSARGVFIFTFMACVVLVVAGNFILRLFGEKFVLGYVPLLILLSGRLISSLSGPVEYLLVMTRHQKAAGVIVVISALVNIGLNGLLVPLMGITGAAIATAFSMILWNISMLFCVYRKLGINPTVIVRHRK